MLERKDTIEHDINTCLLSNNNTDSAYEILDHHLNEIHKLHKLKPKTDSTVSVAPSLTEANVLFNRYVKLLEDSSDDVNISRSLGNYMNAKKEITRQCYQHEAVYWNNLLDANQPKMFWNHVDWKNNTKEKIAKSLMCCNLKAHLKS